MKIKSSQNSGQWQTVKAPVEDNPDPATMDVRRILASAVRSQNLVVLTGLGTSLCVRKDGNQVAPTMGILLKKIELLFDMLDQIDGRPAGTLWASFKRLSNVDPNTTDLEYIMSRATVASEFLTGEDAATIRRLLASAEDTIRDEVDFMDDSIQLPVHEAFLRRVARRSSRRARTKIFTTNYDLCFEIAAGRSGFIVVDGFAFGSESCFDPAQFSYDVVRRSSGEEKSDFIENLFHLHKIHGSVDWELTPANQIAKRRGTDKPLLIYPRSSKYEMAFSQPYIEMMGALQASLRAQNTTLVVIGFGFNDKHIAEPILAAIKGNLSLNLVVINPDVEEKSNDGGNAYLGAIANLIDNGDARLALIGTTFEDIVPLVPDVIAETELERHGERIRNMGKMNV